jgi:hypothetical protein
MKVYKVLLLGNETTIKIAGWLTVYSKHYLIIDKHNNNNYFPKSASVILTENI